jgi:predicted dehydrogenase
MAKRKVRVGVIGAGWWTTYAHLPSLAGHPNAEVFGIADVDLERARATATKYGIPSAFGDHRELLAEKPDAVIVATPHHTHFELARDALEAGADVMVEKPMVIEPDHGRQLVELARRQGRNLHVGYPYLYTRHSQELRRLVEEGAIGDVVLATGLFSTVVHQLYQGKPTEFWTSDTAWAPRKGTYSEPSQGGGHAYTQLTHAASHLFFLSRLRPTVVHGFSSTFDAKVDAWDAIGFQTDSGAVGSVTGTGTVTSVQPTVREYRVFGTAGYALLDAEHGTLSVHYADGRNVNVRRLSAAEIYPAWITSRRLVDTVLGRAPVVGTGELGWQTAAFLGAGLEAAQTGEPVRPNLPETLG